MMDRRGFLGAMLAACAAPAIVRAESLMRVVARPIEIASAEEVMAIRNNSIIDLIKSRIIAAEQDFLKQMNSDLWCGYDRTLRDTILRDTVGN